MRKIIYLAALLALATPIKAAQEPMISRVLSSEIKSAMSMKESGYLAPYYVGITATEYEYREYDCAMGALTQFGRNRMDYVTDNIRVGSYALDNYPLEAPDEFLGHSVNLNDEFALRHGLWRALDADYKSAAAGFLRKQAERAVRGKAEYDTDDFSKEVPRVHLEEMPTLPWSDAEMANSCRQAGSAFRSDPALLSAESHLTESNFWSQFKDSKGSHVDFGGRYADLNMSISGIASDGLEIRAGRDLISTSSSDFPSASKIQAAAAGMLADIAQLKVARTTSPFDAPAILDPSISGAIILALGERLSGEEQRNPDGAQIFRGKIGVQVFPSEFSLEDNPTLENFNGEPLAGRYSYDDQGMPAQPVVLIQNGILRNFLLSRHPVIGFPQSNGHGRGAPGYWIQGFPGVLILRAERPLSRNALIARLRRECLRLKKPYGIFAERLLGFSQNRKTSGEGSIRIVCEMVYIVNAQTGKRTLIRNLDLVETPIAFMNSILAAGKDMSVQNSIRYGVPVSVVAPSLLLSDIETQRSDESPEKGPILPPPSPETANAGHARL